MFAFSQLYTHERQELSPSPSLLAKSFRSVLDLLRHSCDFKASVRIIPCKLHDTLGVAPGKWHAAHAATGGSIMPWPLCQVLPRHVEVELIHQTWPHLRFKPEDRKIALQRGFCHQMRVGLSSLQKLKLVRLCARLLSDCLQDSRQL